ncbi:4-hydroxyphenylpyruvate dioxygenase-like protein [Tigriopus californicus]|nr:4-hydroxyphenylpyruvate dioxygenase-like protein [Tigriopus californicus]
MPGHIHHVEWCVSDLTTTKDKLTESYGFTAEAQRKVNGVPFQVALRSGATWFLLTQFRNTKEEDQPQIYGMPLIRSDKAETLFNVCIQVEDVEGMFHHAVEAGAKVIQTPSLIQCPNGHGYVTHGAIKSCVGNVIHSIVNPKSFSGSFLPGFERITSKENSEHLTESMDHLTYVCETGQSQAILDWYAKCFGMERFMVNPEESEPEGIVIGEEVGMRMKVGEWISSWMCNEIGAKFPTSSDSVDDTTLNFKLVLAEPLAGYPESHVQKFLDEHGGPGLQHIGLTSSTIASTVATMNHRGAEFRSPPPTYYTMASKKSEITQSGFDLKTFQKLGLLIDTEADPDGPSSQTKALIQVFTKPLFQGDTFFLEVLQRQGARGFGAGNITALARSIQLYQQEQEGREIPHGQERNLA